MESTDIRGTIVVKSVGVIRRLDSQSRLVIPSEFRKQFQLKGNTPVEMIGTNEGLLVRSVPNKE